MCQKCIDAVKQHYPDLEHPQIGQLLMGVTCFPFGTPEQIEDNLIKVKKNTDGSLEAALTFADSELHKQLKK